MTDLVETSVDSPLSELQKFREAASLQQIVEAEMEAICNSAAFKTSRKCREFLRYVVRVTLSRRVDLLKERSIGIDLMGCDLSYDPGSDARVRVRAKEVRQRLTTFYAAHPGYRECRISLPLGTYVPEFIRNEEQQAPALNPETQNAPPTASIPEPETLAIPKLSALSMFCPAGIALFLFCFLLRGQVLRTSSYNYFWGELFQGKSTLAIDIDPARPLVTESIPFAWLAGRFGLQPSMAKASNEAALSSDLVVHLASASAPALIENHSIRYLIEQANGKLFAIDRSTNNIVPLESVFTFIPGHPSQLWINSVDEASVRRMIQILTGPEHFPAKLHDVLPINNVVQVALPLGSTTPIIVGDKISQP